MCENSLGSTTQHDGWQIQQTRNCATAMTGEVQATPLANQNVAYDASATLVSKASGFADFFTNTTRMPIEKIDEVAFCLFSVLFS